MEKLILATSISKHHAVHVGDSVHDCVTCPYPSAAGGQVICNFRSLISLLILSFVIVMSYHVYHVRWRMIQLLCIALETSCTQHCLMKSSKAFLKHYIIFSCHLHCGEVTWLHKVICSLIYFCSCHSRQWCCKRQPVSAVG